MKIVIISFFFFTCPILYSQDQGHSGGPVPISNCINEVQYKAIKSHISNITRLKTGSKMEDMLFDDPMGNGGINSFGKTVTNYVDLDPTSSLLDYNCGQITYNFHQGTDIEILNFYEMDEGVPLLCTAPGTVVFSHDGEFDRHAELEDGAVANAVIVLNTDSSQAWYWHMKKNSVLVEVGDTVATGDNLGYVGSSGYSTAPHIHFEIQHNGTVDPFQGPCQSDSSRWIEQGEYVLDLPFELMDHGLTTIPLSWAMVSERPPTKIHVTAPGPIYSWMRLRNVLSTDVLAWEFYANGSLWNSYSFSPDNTYSSSWWYVWWYLPTASYYYGNWTLKISRNDSLLAEQAFTYDNEQNQLPTIDDLVLDVDVNVSTVLDGEFLANDPDGSIFWYEITDYPTNGALEQYGGRKRNFTYTPNEGFVGQDTVIFYAIDDENAEGESGIYVFNVLDSLSVAGLVSYFPNSFYLTQNYPNPFNPVTTISYQLPQSAVVNLSVYNLTGQIVETLVNEHNSAGYHIVTWNSSHVSSGLYFYRIEAGEYAETKKCVILK